ncbi:MAG: hypothetical protein IKE61_00010 [Coriobacteriales bacterium]|nr:hypothetical protein [Coriobacteriales bacterium]
MKDERIVDAFDAVKPDDEAKARMLAAIISKGSSEDVADEAKLQAPEDETAAQGRKVVEVDFASERRKRQRRRRFAGIGAAACLVLVVIIASSLGIGSNRSADTATKSSEISEMSDSEFASESDAVDNPGNTAVPTSSASDKLFARYDSASYSMVEPDDPRFADAKLGEPLGTAMVGEDPDPASPAGTSVKAFSLVGFEPSEAIAVKAADLDIGISAEFVIFAISE